MHPLLALHHRAAAPPPACCDHCATTGGSCGSVGAPGDGTLGATDEMHTTGRDQLVDGFALELGADYTPSLEELQALGAIATLESSYGRGWSGPMVGSNNWGAITCGKQPDADGNCPPGCSPNKDTSPYSGEYVTCFRRWDTPAGGAAGLIHLIYKWPEVVAALRSGNLDEVSWTMRERGYYLGTSKDHREAARTHAGGLEKHTTAIAAALGEPLKAWRKGEDWTPGDGTVPDGGSPDGTDPGAPAETAPSTVRQVAKAAVAVAALVVAFFGARELARTR